MCLLQNRLMVYNTYPPSILLRGVRAGNEGVAPIGGGGTGADAVDAGVAGAETAGECDGDVADRVGEK